MTDQYFVIGNPIEHSKSPEIHRLFAAQTGESMYYGKFLAPVDGFAEALSALIDEGLRGANITVPFKQDAFACCQQLSTRAQRAGAVNTLVISEDGDYIGDNTDGTGLLRDLIHNHNVQLAERDVLVLGAGGAVRGVLEPLLDQKPRRVVIANRTVEKAAALASDFSDLGTITGCGFDELEQQQFDVIINGTAAGLEGKIPPIPSAALHPGGVTYDMMYSREPTAFVRWGHQASASKALDGLGMLVEQAAESFYLWRGKRPDTQAVLRHLRAA